MMFLNGLNQSRTAVPSIATLPVYKGKGFCFVARIWGGASWPISLPSADWRGWNTSEEAQCERVQISVTQGRHCERPLTLRMYVTLELA